VASLLPGWLQPEGSGSIARKPGAGERRISGHAAAAGPIYELVALPVDRTRLRPRERARSRRASLSNVTLYWLSGTVGSSMHVYRVNGAIPPAQHARRVGLPSGFSLFPGDIVRPLRPWLERTVSVVGVIEPARRAPRALRGARAIGGGVALLPAPGGSDGLGAPPRGLKILVRGY